MAKPDEIDVAPTPIGYTSVTPESVRARLQAMDDDTLKRFGKDAAYMCSPEANRGNPPRKEFLLQLREARAEWKRRQAGKPSD